MCESVSHLFTCFTRALAALGVRMWLEVPATAGVRGILLIRRPGSGLVVACRGGEQNTGQLGLTQSGYGKGTCGNDGAGKCDGM